MRKDSLDGPKIPDFTCGFRAAASFPSECQADGSARFTASDFREHQG